MTTVVHPLITFLDHTESVLRYYRDVFGGELTLLRYRDVGLADTADADRIIRGTLTTPHGLHLVAGDVPSGMPFEYGRNISLILDGEEDDVRAWFDTLAADGTVTVPITEMPWQRVFGHVLDKYGVGWIIDMARGDDGRLRRICADVTAEVERWDARSCTSVAMETDVAGDAESGHHQTLTEPAGTGGP